MSYEQVSDRISICIIANGLFGRGKYGKCKPFRDLETIDPNNLPRMNIVATEQCLEAMDLNAVVEELM